MQVVDPLSVFPSSHSCNEMKKNMKMKNSLNLFRLDLSVGQLYSLEAVPAYLKYIPFPFIEFKAAEVCFVKIPIVSDSVKSTCWLAD